MVLDITALILIILFFIRGYMKGVIVAAFSVLAILLGIICTLKLSGKLAEWLLARGIVTSGWGQLISYVALFIGVFLLVRLLAKLLETSMQAMMLGFVNKLIGGVLYGFVTAVVWSSFLWIANQMHLISPETIAASKTYKYLQPLAPWVFENIGKVLPFARDVFSDLQQFFNSVNQHIPEHVGTA